MPACTLKNLQEFFADYAVHEGLEPRLLAKRLKAVIPSGSGNREGHILSDVNKLIDGHGVEAIRGEYHVDNYHHDIVATYVNTGDSYSPTVLYETETGRFLVTTFGDWVEKHSDKYRIQ